MDVTFWCNRAYVIGFVFLIFNTKIQAQNNISIENTWALMANGCGNEDIDASVENLLKLRVQRSREEILIFENGTFSSSHSSNFKCDLRVPVVDQIYQDRFMYCGAELLNQGNYNIFENIVFLDGRVIKRISDRTNGKGSNQIDKIFFNIKKNYLILKWDSFDCGKGHYYEVFRLLNNELLS